MSRDEIWSGVDRFVDRAPSLQDLHSHRLHLLALKRWRALGREIPAWLAAAEVNAAVRALALPAILEHVRAAYSEPMVVVKGPETAAFYEDSALRPFSDVDLIVRDSSDAQRALIEYGFVPVGDASKYVGIHQLRPLQYPGTPLPIEVHHAPKWLDGVKPPPAEELLGSATPSSVAEGFLTLPHGSQAVLAAAHSWAHSPLRRALELVDVLVLVGDERASASAQAERWGIGRVWEVTLAAADAAILGGPRTWALRLWARNVALARERTVLENHLERWFSGFWSLPPQRAAHQMLAAARADVTPSPGEEWSSKLRRSRMALTHAMRRRGAHDLELDALESHVHEDGGSGHSESRHVPPHPDDRA